MKKLLICKEIHHLLLQEQSFLDRSDLRVFIVANNDEALAVHRVEKVDLIVTRHGLPGMQSSELCRTIREDPALRTVSIILACADNAKAIKDSSSCRANCVLLDPLHPIVVAAKAEQLLNIAARESLRVLLTADVEGHLEENAFYCRTGNVSASGLLIETGKKLAADTRLSCQFSLPNSSLIKASGKILRVIEPAARRDSYQYGVMFTELAPEARLLLEEYVESTRRQQKAGSDPS